MRDKVGARPNLMARLWLEARLAAQQLEFVNKSMDIFRGIQSGAIHSNLAEIGAEFEMKAHPFSPLECECNNRVGWIYDAEDTRRRRRRRRRRGRRRNETKEEGNET